MKFSELKKMIYKTTNTFVLSIFIASSLTGCALKFDKNEDSPLFSSSETETIDEDEVTQEFVNYISVTVDETDWSDQTNIQENADKIVESATTYAQNNENLSDFQKVSIVRVVDGDTIVVDIEADHCDSKEHEAIVRLIGINTPESVAPDAYLDKTGKENTEDGKQASEYIKNILKDVEYVYLQKDVSETDPYGRLLRYVWLDIPNDEYDLTEIANEMVNGILVKNHVAEVTTYHPDTKHAADFEMIYNGEYDEFLYE